MAERSTAKAKRSEAAKAVPKSAGEVHWATEKACLEAELAAARVRIADLERKHAEIINRIDWVIDSLHNLHD
ncbi:MAG: hypothetical protein ABL907_17220 [Hyphomicrobium sp.]